MEREYRFRVELSFGSAIVTVRAMNVQTAALMVRSMIVDGRDFQIV